MPDTKLVKHNKLPVWLKLDTLYLFKHDKDGDNSKFIKEISARYQKFTNNQRITSLIKPPLMLSEASYGLIFRDMVMVEPMHDTNMEGKYNFRIELQDTSMEFIGTQFASETNNWLKALKMAKKTMDEIGRTSDGKLRRNINYLVDFYKGQPKAQLRRLIIAKCEKFISKFEKGKDGVDIGEAINSLQKAQDHFKYVKMANSLV